MKIEIPLDELTRVMCDVHPDLCETIEGQKTTGPDLIIDLLAERSGRILAMHNAMHFCIHEPENNLLIVDTDWLHFIGEISGFIQFCYDNDGELDLPSNHNMSNYLDKNSGDAWAVFALGGDNDVDNCGSNITDLLEGIFEYLKRHHIECKPLFPVITA